MGFGYHQSDGCHLYADNSKCGNSPSLNWYTCGSHKPVLTGWDFETRCSTGSSTCETKHVKKHCYHQRLGTTKYASWAIAKAACAANSNCFGVYDNGCRKSSIYLCDSRKITSSAKLSKSGSSCVFENP